MNITTTVVVSGHCIPVNIKLGQPYAYNVPLNQYGTGLAKYKMGNVYQVSNPYLKEEDLHV